MRDFTDHDQDDAIRGWIGPDRPRAIARGSDAMSRP
jgi:hypothetical protein